MEMFFLERLKPETAEHPEKLMLSDSMISPG
jgi:hypothetical protein